MSQWLMKSTASAAVLMTASCAQSDEVDYETSIDPGGCVLEHIAVDPEMNHFQYDSLSPDGDLLAVGWQRGEEEQGTFLLDLKTGERTELPHLNNGAVFAPDGASFVNSVYVDNGKTDIIEVDRETGAATPIAPHDEWDWLASYSSDGDIILFNSFRSGRSDIYSYHKPSGELTQWTDFEGYEAHAQFSPDDLKILFHRHDEEFGFDLYVIDVATSDLTQITTDESEESYGSWSPAGDMIVFSSDRRQEPEHTDLFLMDANGDNIRGLTNHPAKDAYPFFSPDGKYIYFNSAREPQGVYRLSLDEKFDCLTAEKE